MLILNVVVLLIIFVIYFYGKLRAKGEEMLRGVLWSFLFWQFLNNFIFRLDGWIVIGCNGIFIAIMLFVYSKSVSKRRVE